MKINKARMEVLDSVINRLRFAHDWCVQVVDTSPLMSRKPEFEINWCACGSVPTDEALTFKAQLDFCITLANKLNELEIEVVDGDDDLITGAPDYDKWVAILTEYITDNMAVHSSAVKLIITFLKHNGEARTQRQSLEAKKADLERRMAGIDEEDDYALMVCRQEIANIDSQLEKLWAQVYAELEV